MNDEKLCVKEQHWVPRTEFYKQAGSKDGLDPYCKQCRKRTNREYSANNRAIKNDIQRAYYYRHHEEVKAKAKANARARAQKAKGSDQS
jgi:hypothetical protein